MPTPTCSVRQTVVVTMICGFANALAPATAIANGTRLPNQGAEATARGNAFVATADNPSAIYYNPAGLTQLPGVQIQSDTYLIDSRYEYRAPGGPTVQAARDPSVIPQLYATWTPPGSRASYGIGIYSPFGQATDWPDDSGFRTIATRNEIIFVTVAPTVAYKLSEHLSIGAGLQINRVDADLRRGLGIAPGDQLRFEGDDTSLGYNLGLLWHINERHVVGLCYQSRSTSHLKGDVTLSPPVNVEAPAQAELPFPDTLALGYSWRPTPEWNLEVSVDRTNWELLNTLPLSAPGAGLNIAIPFHWKASYYYSLGVTRRLSEGWRVSAGYCYSENSVPDATFNPAVPDMSRHLASFGVGRTFGALDVFFMYQHGFRASREVPNASPPAPPVGGGRYRTELDAVDLSFRYSF